MTAAGPRAPRPDPGRGLGSRVLEDLRHPGLHRTLARDLEDLYLFYLDDERRTALAGMGRLRRWLRLGPWLLRSLVERLAPLRRLLLVAALAGFVAGWADVNLLGVDTRIPAFLVLLVVLALELKDKLLARDEIEVAQRVQRALLPDRDPSIRGWTIWSTMRPANDVGGDLVDFLDLGPRGTALVLADVAGKGMGAALLSARLQAWLRALTGEDAPLEALGSRLNDLFCRGGLPNRFATLFYLEIRPDSGSVRFLNAGHNPPLVVRREGLEPIPAGSLPLGMIGSARYAEGRLDLAPGECLWIYSDGLTEARSESGEEFGMGRLRAALGTLRGAPPAAGVRLLQELDRFRGTARLHDDLSLVVLRREEG